MARTTVGLFNTREQAEQAIRDLREAGFDEKTIGMILPDRPSVVQDVQPDTADEGSRSTEGAVAGGVIGGTLGAILAATGALVIPGIGPFIAGGILVSLIGGTAGWLVGGLAGLGVAKEDATYYEEQVQSGRPLVAVQAGDREADAVRILTQNGGETQRQDAMAGVPASDTYSSTLAQSKTNLAQDSGQMSDMMRTRSDDGTVPPTVEREAITTGKEPRTDFVRAVPGMSPDVRTTDTIGPDAKDLGMKGADKSEPARADYPMEATDSNPVPLSPTDPRRRTDEGQPYLDEANPFGRAIPNRQDQPMGGVGVVPDLIDPQNRNAKEQPGDGSANPLPQGLNPEPRRDPDRG